MISHFQFTMAVPPLALIFGSVQIASFIYNQHHHNGNYLVTACLVGFQILSNFTLIYTMS